MADGSFLENERPRAVMSKDQDPQNFPVSGNQDVESLTRGAENSEEVRVLVVDDEALIRWAMAATLKDAGYDVVEASSGQEAMASLHGHPDPHVIFLDYRLADSQDLTLLRNIRAAVPECPVIMMTAYATPEMVEAAARLGAYRVVGKPFDMGDIVSLTRHACSSRLH
jgi:DNA-binding NtrC family response regulator